MCIRIYTTNAFYNFFPLSLQKQKQVQHTHFTQVSFYNFPIHGSMNDGHVKIATKASEKFINKSYRPLKKNLPSVAKTSLDLRPG